MDVEALRVILEAMLAITVTVGPAYLRSIIRTEVAPLALRVAALEKISGPLPPPPPPPVIEPDITRPIHLDLSGAE
jgi:hypothetical protein